MTSFKIKPLALDHPIKKAEVRATQKELNVELASHAFYLAWRACGGPLGMGFLQDKPGATKEQVLNNVVNSDYGGLRKSGPGEFDGDYVFGRMMKLTIRFDDETVSVPDSDPRPDYQAWCKKYPSYESLIEAAAKELAFELLKV